MNAYLEQNGYVNDMNNERFHTKSIYLMQESFLPKMENSHYTSYKKTVISYLALQSFQSIHKST